MKISSKTFAYSSAFAVAAVLSACGSDSDTGTPPIPPGDAVLAGNITQSRTLYRDTTYTLQGYVKVTNGATLTIQDGTKIVGDYETLGSSLWILPGSKLMAEGTAARPIVFTSERPVGSRKPGDWGGIIIIGRGKLNRTVNPIFTEGPSSVSENYAGGTNNDDNSGSLRYVRIEFAGYDISGTGQELNALSMYAVGRGTKLEYVQTLAGLDDSFEWFGGAVDGRYLASFESGDDHFDWTESYSGRNQFLIAFQAAFLEPRTGAGIRGTDPRGFEGDGCESAKPGCIETNQPFSMPVFANFTLIGPGPGVYAAGAIDGGGVVIRRGSGGSLVNGVIARWPGSALSVRDATSDALRVLDSLMVQNVTFADNGGTFHSLAAALNIPANNITEGAGTAASYFASLSTGSLDFTPAVGSSIINSGVITLPAKITARGANFFGGTLMGTSYRGAADPAATAKWWAGWTNYAQN